MVGSIPKAIEAPVPLTVPLWSIPFALIGTLVLAAVVVIAPVRRAARLRPGDALRYE